MNFVFAALTRLFFFVACFLTLCALVVYFSAGSLAERVCFAYLELAQARAAGCQIQDSLSRPYNLTNIFQLSEKSLRRANIVLTGLRYDSPQLTLQSENGVIALDLLRVLQVLFSQEKNGFELGLLAAVSEMKLVNVNVLLPKTNSLHKKFQWSGFFQLNVASRAGAEAQARQDQEKSLSDSYAVSLDLTDFALQKIAKEQESSAAAGAELKVLKAPGEPLLLKGMLSSKNLSDFFAQQTPQAGPSRGVVFELKNASFGDDLHFAARYDTSQRLAEFVIEPIELILLDRFDVVPQALHGLRIGTKAQLFFQSATAGSDVSFEAHTTSLGGYVDGKELRRLIEPEIAKVLFSHVEPALLREGLNMALSLPGPERSKTIATLKHFGLKPDIIQGSGKEARLDLSQVLPDKMEVQKGEARISATWKAGLLESHDSKLSLLSKGIALDVWHATTESEMAPNVRDTSAARGELRVALMPEEATAPAEELHVSLDLAVHSPDFKPVVSLSEEERNRLLAKITQVKLPFGLGGDEPIKLNIPPNSELKVIEKAGKDWLKALLDKNEGGDASSKEEAKRKMKDSEKILKEALGKVLGK